MYRFERIVKALLSVFKETQMWDSLPTVIPLVEKIMARVVASVQAQNSKYTTIILLSHIVPSQIVSKKICFSFVLLSNYVSYFPLFIIFFFFIEIFSF